MHPVFDENTRSIFLGMQNVQFPEYTSVFGLPCERSAQQLATMKFVIENLGMHGNTELSSEPAKTPKNGVHEEYWWSHIKVIMAFREEIIEVEQEDLYLIEDGERFNTALSTWSILLSFQM